MFLEHLQVQNLRIVDSVNLKLSPKINLFYGDNGSGKTSLLESIYLLGVGRSFRTHQIKTVISKGKSKLNVFGKFSEPESFSLGVERGISGSYKVRINNQDQNKLSRLAQYLPVLIITPESHQLISAGPLFRRQFLDFSVFHVEQQYSTKWQRYSRILKQRNSLLKTCKSYDELAIWDVEFAKLSTELNSMRNKEFLLLKPQIEAIQRLFLSQYKVQYRYYSGWEENGATSFIERLEQNYTQDKKYGYSGIGAHKADIRMTIGAQPVQDVLSRGEQKMLVSSMILAQSKRIAVDLNKYCAVVLDDLASELDTEKQSILLEELLNTKNCQIFISSIYKNLNEELLYKNKSVDITKFHVEHGTIIS